MTIKESESLRLIQANVRLGRCQTWNQRSKAKSSLKVTFCCWKFLFHTVRPLVWVCENPSYSPIINALSVFANTQVGFSSKY